MRTTNSKNKKAIIAQIEQTSGDPKSSIGQTLAKFFDAASFKSYENTLADILQTYILEESEYSNPAAVANNVYTVRLITNLLFELSRVHEQLLLIDAISNMEGGESC